MLLYGMKPVIDPSLAEEQFIEAVCTGNITFWHHAYRHLANFIL